MLGIILIPWLLDFSSFHTSYYVLRYLFFFFFQHVHTRERGGKIQISDIHFMRPHPQLIELPIGNTIYYILMDLACMRDPYLIYTDNFQKKKKRSLFITKLIGVKFGVSATIQWSIKSFRP
jgi:hypothetical protein